MTALNNSLELTGKVICQVASGICCAALFLFAGGGLQAGNFVLERTATVQYDLGGVRMPEWTGGALLTVLSNQTPAPAVLSFDAQGVSLPTLILTVPGAETVDVDDVARGLDGSTVACGSAYDHSGRGSGFLAIFGPRGEKLRIVRLAPYFPSRITVANDGTIWTVGLELRNAMDVTPAGSGVLRHFDGTGKQIESFIARSTFSSSRMVQYTGRLSSARGRIGWYTGPGVGPGSRYYEILSDGTVRSYPPIHLGDREFVTGLALTDDGRTFVSTRDKSKASLALKGSCRLLSIGGPGQGWIEETAPSQLLNLWLYGAEDNRLVLHYRDRFSLGFLSVLPNR